MVSIVLMALVISQLISFFLIILLNMKVSKFKDIEARQAQVIREMDDAIGMYLMDMKEENDRLIRELSQIEPMELRSTFIKEQKVNTERVMPPKTIVPISLAANVYNKQKPLMAEVQPIEKVEDTVVEKQLAPFEQQVLQLHAQGLSIKDIAKQTQKGKTEIELLIKFHS